MKLIKRIVPTSILLGAVTAIAQPDPPAAAPPAANVSATDMRTQSAAIVSQAQDDYQYVLKLQVAVRKKKDVIKLDCVNDRLVQLKAQLNIAEKGNESLLASLDRNPSQAQDQFTQLSSTGKAIKELREQANQCVGEPELYKQEAGIEVTRPLLPDDPGVIDPTELPTGAIVVEPPGYASAFQ